MTDFHCLWGQSLEVQKECCLPSIFLIEHSQNIDISPEKLSGTTFSSVIALVLPSHQITC